MFLSFLFLVAVLCTPADVWVYLFPLGLVALIPPQSRRLFTVPYAESTTERVYSPDFPRALYSGLSMRLTTGTVTKTETTPGVLSDTVFSLIRGIRVLGDGDVIRDISPSHLRILSHHIFRGQDTNHTHITLGTDAAEPISGRLEMDFQSQLMKLPHCSYFPGHRYDQLTFEVDWGAPGSLVAGGTYSVAPAFATQPKLEVWGEEIKDPAYRGLDYLLLKNTQKVFSVNAVAQNDTQFYLPSGEQYRGILVSQYTRNPDKMIDTLLTAGSKISVRVDGSARPLETTWEELRQRNQAKYRIALPTGYAFIDFCEDGDLQRVLRTTKDVTLEIAADTASVANAFLQFTLLTYKPAPRANAGR